VAEINGGITAPAPERGLGSARRPRSVNRRQTPKGKKIARSVAEQQQARQARDNGGTPASPVDPGYSNTPAAPHPAIGPAVNTDLGAQLSGRVSSGAIDQQQAQQVAHDRAILEAHYGPGWRVKVFGGAGRVQRLRKDIAEHGPDELGAKARLGQLLAKRSRMLKEAE
jgi:hypothetical protein